MTTNECKKDCAERLAQAGVKFTKLKARTVSFEGFGYGIAVFVKICGPVWTETVRHRGDLKKGAFASVPKPSDGGYCIETDEGGFS
jgi:hypothetical protein